MRSWKNFKALILCAALVLAACQPNPGSHYPLTIRTGSGTQQFQVEVALTPQEQEQGLMFRKHLDTDKGMLFVFPISAEQGFWMKNTYIPLDLLFIRADGSIAHIAKMAKPFDRSLIPSTEPVKAVLEIAGGEADKRNITTHSHVETDQLK